MKNDRFSKQGRAINRKATDREIDMYLGLEKDIDNSGTIKEYKQFENKYYNQNVEFCLLCDIESGLIKPTNIIEKGKYLVVFE
ncbi:MAG: hypothetical protein ACI3T9_03885 [Romboutsia timonensis]